MTIEDSEKGKIKESDSENVPEEAVEKNWYLLKDTNRRITQIVIELPEGESLESEFGSLILPDKYQNLNTKEWTTGYFRTVSKPGPYIMVRADGYIDLLKNCPLRIAFSFYKEPSAGIFALFVSAEYVKEKNYDDIRQIVRSVLDLRKASPTGHAVFECIFGLDSEDAVQRIRDGLSKDNIHICFADKATNMNRKSIGGDGNSTELSPPGCRFDRVFPVEEDCRELLIEQFEDLLKYHRTTGKNFQRAIQELSDSFPASESPILETNSKKDINSFFETLARIPEPLIVLGLLLISTYVGFRIFGNFPYNYLNKSILASVIFTIIDVLMFPLGILLASISAVQKNKAK